MKGFQSKDGIDLGQDDGNGDGEKWLETHFDDTEKPL